MDPVLPSTMTLDLGVAAQVIVAAVASVFAIAKMADRFGILKFIQKPNSDSGGECPLNDKSSVTKAILSIHQNSEEMVRVIHELREGLRADRELMQTSLAILLDRSREK